MGRSAEAANVVQWRLEVVGVPDIIAFAIGQAAYVEPELRPPWIPQPIVPPTLVVWKIQEFERSLASQNHLKVGPLMVWTLCQQIFGASAETIYDAAYPQYSKSKDSFDREDPMIKGSLRYFDTVDLSFQFDRVSVAATYAPRTEDDAQRWDGILILWDGQLGFFERSDWEAEDTSKGNPLLFDLGGLRACTALKPPTLHLPELNYVKTHDKSTNFICVLDFTENRRFRFAVWLVHMPADLVGLAYETISDMVTIFDKAIGFQTQQF